MVAIAHGLTDRPKCNRLHPNARETNFTTFRPNASRHQSSRRQDTGIGQYDVAKDRDPGYGFVYHDGYERRKRGEQVSVLRKDKQPVLDDEAAVGSEVLAKPGETTTENQD